MEENPEKLREKWSEILQANGIEDKISEVIVSDSGALGNGMASVTQRVTIMFEDNEKDPLNLFVKLHSTNPTHEAMLTELKAFEKEASFLMEYLPAAKEFYQSNGLNAIIDFFPKCFFGDDRMIVLENLVLKDYELIPHEQRHDFETTSFVLKTLAKHHAISYAMIEEGGGADNFFQRFPHLREDGMATPMMANMMTSVFENALETCLLIVKKNKLNGGEDLLEELSNLKEKTTPAVLHACDITGRNDLLVLIHGDFKNNNLMFLRNKDTNAILHLMAIDLQGACYNPAVSDISCYLFSSVDPTVRQTRLKDLLKVYLNTLNEVSNDLGFPIELSDEDLLMQFRRNFEYGFFFGMSMVGPGMGLAKSAGIDVSKIDMTDLPSVLHQCLLKWIDENPDKGRSMAEEIESLVEEYNFLKA